MSAVDGELIELRKLNREEACAVYDMPPPMVQILDRATFSNIDEQHQMLYVDTLGPWLGNFDGHGRRAADLGRAGVRVRDEETGRVTGARIVNA
jgi:phage portal protein BeeE